MRAVSHRGFRTPSRAIAVAMEVPFPGFVEGIAMRDRLIAMRDTIVVLSIQVVFRAAMWFRRRSI